MEVLPSDNLMEVEGVSIKDDRLVFSSVSNYENLINNQSKIDLNAFARSSQFTSAKIAGLADASLKTKDIVKIDNEFLASILSPEGIIQIEKWIFKVNPQKEVVTVLETENLNEQNYSDLINDRKNPKIYSFQDRFDVIDLLQEGYTSVPEELSNLRTQILCGGGVSSGTSYKTTDNYSAVSSPNVSAAGITSSKVEYDKFGIYFEADLKGYAIIKTTSQNPITSSLIYSGRFDKVYSYETNCRNSWGRNIDEREVSFVMDYDYTYTDQTTGYVEVNYYYHDKIYQGSRGLKYLRVYNWDLYVGDNQETIIYNSLIKG